MLDFKIEGDEFIMYQLYTCKCKKEFILITEYIDNNKGYLCCPYCGNKHIRVVNKYDSLRDCMENVRVYKRINGSLREVK